MDKILQTKSILDHQNSISNRKYDLIFSFGEACLCASILKSLGLRELSSPYDWMYGSTFEGRVNLFLNNFKNFLNKENLVFIGQRDNPEPCDIYENTSTNMVFNHDFPLNTPLDDSFYIVKEKYNKRINRLFDKIKTAKKVLIVYMELPDSKDKVDEKKIRESIIKINKKFNTSKIDILFIRHDDNLKDGELIFNLDEDNVIIATCYNNQRFGENRFSGSIDNVKPILKNIKLQRNFWDNIKYKTRKIGRKVVSIFYSRRVKIHEEYIRILGIKIKINKNR